MPIYEFKCTKCGQEYEEQRKIGDYESSCPVCNSESEKLMSKASFSVVGGSSRTADQVIGESAAKRWEQIEESKNKRQKNMYGSTVGNEAKENQRISSILNKQQDAYSKISEAKKNAGITKSDEIKHAIGG